MGAFNLDGEAYTFAERITDLLNGTVAVGVRITPVTSGSPPRAVLGYGISARQLDNNLAIPLRVKPKARARAFLAVSFRLRLDDESQHLAVVSSFVGLFADEALERALLSYDYERDKPDDYPEAHIQVRASSDDWTELLGDDEPLAKLHLPVGGRRFRPCIEDFLEMLIREGIAEGHDGWKKRVRDGRTWFHQLQLKAAIRRDPETAIAALSKLKADGTLQGECTLELASVETLVKPKASPRGRRPALRRS